MPSTNGHGLKRAILYARVSTDEQARSGCSLAQQLEALREYAACEGYEVLEEVSDPGQSGASLQRPGMDRARDLVAAGGVSVVLAQDRDRFSREPAYHYLLRREFEEHGTKMRALNDRGDESPEGELTDGILDQLAKYERAKTAERRSRSRTRPPDATDRRAESLRRKRGARWVQPLAEFVLVSGVGRPRRVRSAVLARSYLASWSRMPSVNSPSGLSSPRSLRARILVPCSSNSLFSR